MTRIKVLALLLVLLGAAGMIYCALTGAVQVGLLFFMIPYLYGGTALGAISILAVVAGVMLPFVDAMRKHAQEGPASPTPMENAAESRTEWGGVVLIGPVPIVFGSAPRSALIALGIVTALLMALLVLFLFVR